MLLRRSSPSPARLRVTTDRRRATPRLHEDAGTSSASPNPSKPVGRNLLKSVRYARIGLLRARYAYVTFSQQLTVKKRPFFRKQWTVPVWFVPEFQSGRGPAIQAGPGFPGPRGDLAIKHGPKEAGSALESESCQERSEGTGSVFQRTRKGSSVTRYSVCMPPVFAPRTDPHASQAARWNKAEKSCGISNKQSEGHRPNPDWQRVAKIRTATAISRTFAPAAPQG
jgi:hypothetical protein